MKHYIVTRNSYPADYPDLEQRLEILSDFVVPALRNQTSQDFTWVLTSSVGTGDLDLTGIDHIILDFPAPHTFGATNYMCQQIVSELARDAPKGEMFVSTRLDNDDILLPHFVESVQGLASSAEVPLVIDAPGYRVDMRYNRVYRDTQYAEKRIPSPFISVVEWMIARRCRLRSAYYDQHSKMHWHFDVAYLPRPTWVQLIHRSNKTMARSLEEVEARGELLPYQASEFLEGAIAARPIADHLW